MVIPGECFICDQDISRCPPLRVCGHEECIVCIFGYVIWLCGVHYISGDGTPFAMFLPTWPICLDLVEGLSRRSIGYCHADNQQRVGQLI